MTAPAAVRRLTRSAVSGQQNCERPIGAATVSVHHLARVVLDVQVWNFKAGDSFQRCRECLVHLLPAAFRSHDASEFPQGAQDLRSVESLAFAVFAEAHCRMCPLGADVTTLATQ